MHVCRFVLSTRWMGRSVLVAASFFLIIQLNCNIQIGFRVTFLLFISKSIAFVSPIFFASNSIARDAADATDYPQSVPWIFVIKFFLTRIVSIFPFLGFRFLCRIYVIFSPIYVVVPGNFGTVHHILEPAAIQGRNGNSVFAYRANDGRISRASRYGILFAS